MAMDFFEHQAAARRRTGRLVALFAVAVVLIVAAVYLAVLLAASVSLGPEAASELAGDPGVLVIAAGSTLGLIGLGCLLKMGQLAGGGRVVAEALGGRLLMPDSRDPHERRLLNVVEEMSLASGVAVPSVYLLEDRSINAFAAGFSASDAVVGVTQGALRKLSREELQGVIAHEFSHILNGDMRLNLRLIGWISGIAVLAQLGWLLLRSLRYVRLSGGSGRSGGGKGKGGAGAVLLAMIVLAALLIVIGFIGALMGRIIQAAVSRQREHLADAAAVQFTRNPQGLAGALKKIGASVAGSTVSSDAAGEARHLFFASCAAGWLDGVFASHPPLLERIRRLDPTFNGDFSEVRLSPDEAPPPAPESAGQAAWPIGRPLPAVSAALAPDLVRQAVGAAGQADLRAAPLMGAGPDQLAPGVVELARQPYAARALIYALLLSPEGAMRQAQLAALKPLAEPPVFDLLLRLAERATWLSPRLRLPLIDLSVPALRQLSRRQFEAFKEKVKVLIEADRRVDLSEWMLQKVILHRLEPNFTGRAGRAAAGSAALPRLLRQASVLFSALAHAGQQTPDAVTRAFDLASARLALPGVQLLPREHCGLLALDQALDALACVHPRQKRLLLQACAECITADRRVTVVEAELLRAVADTLNCPMPPLRVAA